MVEHIAPLRHALGPWLAGMGIFNHMLSDVDAQTVDLILVTVLEPPRPPQGYRRYRDEAIQST